MKNQTILGILVFNFLFLPTIFIQAQTLTAPTPLNSAFTLPIYCPDCLVASSGPGSPGNETNYFGEHTLNALVAFQKAAGITPAIGYFGPKTYNYFKNIFSTSTVAFLQRLALASNDIYLAQSNPQNANSNPPPLPPSFGFTYKYSGDEVSYVQKDLNYMGIQSGNQLGDNNYLPTILSLTNTNNVSNPISPIAPSTNIGSSNPSTGNSGLSGDTSRLPTAGMPNPTLREDSIARYGYPKYVKEPWAYPIHSNGATFVGGISSIFGGPKDQFHSSSETLALYPNFLMRNLNTNDCYMAYRWDYTRTPKEMLKASYALIFNPATNKYILADPVDWGPDPDTGRSIDVSPGVDRALGATTGTPLFFSLVSKNSPSTNPTCSLAF